jgi:tetratricopeptide (TPR) repeat protein
VRVLEAAEKLHPDSRPMQSRLRNARSLLSEQHYFDELERAGQSARTERNRLRCQKLRDTAACDEALQAEPKNAGLVIAKADALAHSNRPAEALPLYRHAAQMDARAPDIETKTAAAESKRQTLLSQCLIEYGEPALRACQLALLPGAIDEFTIYKRKGFLLQRMDEALPALDSFIAAGLLQGDDQTVARAIVALTDSTGRSDGLALAARGRALLTLRRGAEAVKALVQARALLPDVSDIEGPLAVAEELARKEARQSRPATPMPATVSVGAASVKVASDEKRTYSNDSPETRSH